MENQEVFSHWAIVELFGHTKYAGHVKTTNVSGVSMIQLDVPEIQRNGNSQPGFSKFFNQSAIYAITPVDKEYAIEMAAELKKQPVEGYEHKSVITQMAKRAAEQMTLKQMKSLLERKGLLETVNEEVEEGAF